MISFERLCRMGSLFLEGSHPGKRLPTPVLAIQFLMALSCTDLLLATGAANAQMQTVRTEENGVVHHQLENCNHERGVAIAHYTHRHKEPQHHTTHKLELTDMCFQRETGRLWASEPAEDLTLVKQDPSINWYEDLATELGRSGSKGKLSAGGFAPVAGKPDNRASYVDLFFDPTKPNVTRPTEFHQHTADNTRLDGYLFEQQASPENAAGKTYRVILAGFDWGLSDPASGNAGYNRNNSDLGLHWDSHVFEQGGSTLDARASFQSRGDDAGPKAPSGRLRLTFHPDGRISGEGQFQIENPRLAGFEPGEWVSATWKIDRLVGHLTGAGATGFRLKGFASGQTTYHDGYVGRIIGTLDVRGRDLAFEDEFFAGAQ